MQAPSLRLIIILFTSLIHPCTPAGPTVVNITEGSEKEGASAWVPTDVSWGFRGLKVR